jgi:hypothetical protein
MEPSGRNRWQPVANARRSKTAQTGRSATGGNPRQPFRSDGKEGVEMRRLSAEHAAPMMSLASASRCP